MFYQKMALPLFVLVACLGLGGCSTISDWFADDEEIEIRRLKPIEMQFQPELVWDETVGDGVDGYYSRLRPAIGFDRVFAASRQGEVAAFEQESGKRVWKLDLANYNSEGFLGGVSRLWSDGESARLAGGLTLAAETLYIGSENGDVLAIDAKIGKLKWRSIVKGEVISAPAVDAGVVLVNTSSGTLFALDANSGEEKWSYESEVPPLSLRGSAAPATASGGSVIGTANGKLVVSILANGQTAWEQTIGAPSGATELDRIVDIDSKPLILGGTVYVISFDGTLAAVELRSGRVIWKREYKSYRRLSLAGNSLIVVDAKSHVFALDRRNGVELWSQNGLKQRLLTAAEPVGSYVVVGDKWGFLHWLDVASGRIVSRMDIGGDDEDESIYVQPIAEGDMLYTMTREGKLVAVKTPE